MLGSRGVTPRAVCLSERLSWRADGWSVARYTGQGLLAAAWGFTCGLGYFSFFEHLRRYRLGEIDPAPIPTGVVLMIKGVGVLLAIVALVATFRATAPDGSSDLRA